MADRLNDPGLTIPTFFDAAVKRNPDKNFVCEGSESLSYRQFQETTFKAAGYFQGLGVGRGDRVCLILDNSIEHLAAWFGLNRLGAISAPINPRLAPREIQELLRLLDPVLVLAEGELVGIPQGLGLAAEESGVIEQGAAIESGSGVLPGDAATFIATSGSTGKPKAVMQSHRTHVLTGQAFPWWLGLTSSDRLMLVLPLHHINAQAYSVMGAIGSCASIVLAPRFSASRFWDETRQLAVTQFNCVGAMLRMLVNREKSAEDGNNPVRICYTALTMEEKEHRELEERFNMEIVVGYGLSESTFGTVWPLTGPRPYGTIGGLRQHPLLGEINQARVIKENGDEARAGEAGELLLRNPATMLGYYRSPEETERVLSKGWLHTGDVVRRDENDFFTFVGRIKEVIRVRGENVVPLEIENVMLEHPEVSEVGVIGVASALGEQEVKAFVVRRRGSRISAEELQSWCADRLAVFKVPSQVVFRDELPKTETGRVMRREL